MLSITYDIVLLFSREGKPPFPPLCQDPADLKSSIWLYMPNFNGEGEGRVLRRQTPNTVAESSGKALTVHKGSKSSP